MSILHRAKGILDVTSTVAVIAAAGVLIWTLLGNRPVTPPAAGRPPAAQDATGLRIEAARVTNVKGHAAIAIVEFSDYECPFCAAYARTTFPQVERDLIETGQVQYVTFNFPLERIHPHAMKAGEAVECAAEQGSYWEMHKRLFDASPALTPADLAGYAAAIGLDQAQFEECLEGETIEKVRDDLSEGQRLGVAGTPAFFIGRVQDDGAIELVRRLNGVIPFETLKQEVAALTSS